MKVRPINELPAALRHLSSDLFEEHQEIGLLVFQAAWTIEKQQEALQEYFSIFTTADSFIRDLWDGEVIKDKMPPRYVNDNSILALNKLTEKIAKMAWRIGEKEEQLKQRNKQ